MRDKVKIRGDIFTTGVRWGQMLNLDTHILILAAFYFRSRRSSRLR